MQNVSSEWNQNQRELIQKQGFVIVTIKDCDDNVLETIDSRIDSVHIKNITHKRGFEPIGMSLPFNNISIDLYNYNGEYDYLYEDYEYEELIVELQYGYKLTTDEIIAGGCFVSNKVSKSNKIISLNCVSRFEKNSQTVIKQKLDDSSETILFTLYGTYDTNVTSEKLQGQELITTIGNVLAMVENESVVDIESNKTLNEITTYLTNNDDVTVATSIQYASNLGCQKVVINREDVVQFSEYNTAPKTIIYNCNILKTPEYQRSEKIKDIKIVTKEPIANEITTANYNERHGLSDAEAREFGFSGENTVFYREYKVDWQQNIITSITGNIIQVSRSEIPIRVVNEQYLPSAIVMMDSGQRTPGIRIWCYGNGIPTLTFRPRYSQKTYSINVSDSGVTCDINNPCGKPIDTDRIANYYSNRDIYTLTLRGDPAVDIGDYVYVELEPNEYKKALVLESDLVFDGSFKDTMKVRIIETDFEYIVGQSHEQLSDYTHEQLGDYTHNELMIRSDL